MENVLNTDVVCQIGLVVNDIIETGKNYSKFFGVELPPILDSGEDRIVKGEVFGERSDASCKLMFFDLANIQLELIQPDDKPSIWRNLLDENGEGLHHIAFQVKDVDKKIKKLEEEGMNVVQTGNYADASGKFVYVDARDKLKTIIELLTSF